MNASQKKWLAIGLAGGLVVVLLIGIGVYKLWQFGKDELNPPVDAYLMTLHTRDYESMYGQVSTQWRNFESLGQFSEFHEEIRSTLGSSIDRSLTTFNIQNNAGQSYATATYAMEFTSGNADVAFEFTREGPNWRIQSVNYYSPLLAN